MTEILNADRLSKIILAIHVFATTAILIFIPLMADRGFDITDEAFYLHNIWYPYQNAGAVTEFGLYLNSLEPLLGRDIANLRLFGFFWLLLLAGLFALKLTQFCRQNLEEPPSRLELVLLASGIILTTFAYYRYWIITPSYNLFSLSGGLLVCAGGSLLMCGSLRTSRRSASLSPAVLGAGYVGMGGFLAFIGRPTTALALGVLTAIWLIAFHRPRRWLLVGCIAGGLSATLLCLHIWGFRGGWSSFLNHIMVARELAASLDAGHTLGSAFSKFIDAVTSIPRRIFNTPILLSILSAVAMTIVMSKSRKVKATAIIEDRAAWSLVSVCAFSVFCLAWFDAARSIRAISFPGHFGFEAVLLLVCLLLVPKIKIPGGSSQTGRIHFSLFDAQVVSLRLALLFVFAALAVPFGSASALIRSSSTSYVLYFAAASLIILELVPSRLQVKRMVLISLVSLPIVYVLYSAQKHPYRLQTDISQQSEAVTFLDGSSRVLVDSANAQWINKLKNLSVSAGWRQGMTIIDMTGGTPGAAVVLSARASGTPWLVGRYKGSRAYAAKALSLMQLDALRSAWILTAPDGIRRIPIDVLTELGLPFPDRYVQVGRLRTAHRKEDQILWKPASQ